MCKHIISLLLIMLSCSTLLAQNRSRVEARQLAIRESRYASHNLVELNIPIGSVSSGGNKPFYLFTDSSTNSFIVVSGDKKMKNVLCEGNLYTNTDSLPDGLQYLLDEYKRQYEFAQSSSPTVATYALPSPPDISPILKTKWGQGSPYNDDCPSRCPSGCVATAMAQIMKHYEYPQSGIGQYSYTTRTQRFQVSYDFANAVFDWDNMQNEYSGSMTNTSSQRKAVANLMKACGVSVGMDYDRGASGAYSVDIPYALIKYFGYNKNISDYDRNYYRADDWYKILYSELESGRPVLYCGVDSKAGGHAFVVDGVRSSDGKVHVNWGWDGDYDGYFELDALDPQKYRFSTYQDMIVNFCPMEVGTHEDLFYATSFSCDRKLDFDTNCTVGLKEIICYANTASYINKSAQFSGTVGIGLFDENFSLIKKIAEKDMSDINCYSYFDTSFNINIRKQDVNGEKCYVAPFVQGKTSGAVTRIRTFGGNRDYFVLNDDGDGGGNEEEPDIRPESVWEEDFENGNIPNGWSQEIVQGAAEWNPKQVLFASGDAKYPNAFSGNGYMSLAYRSSDIFSMNRTITRLISGYSNVESLHTYTLSFECCKYKTSAESSELVMVYLDRGNGWEIIAELPITNNNWVEQKISFETSKPYRLAFEGSLDSGALVHIDKVSVSESTGTGIKQASRDDQKFITFSQLRSIAKEIKVFSINGVIECKGNAECVLNLPKGIHIVDIKGERFKFIQR